MHVSYQSSKISAVIVLIFKTVVAHQHTSDFTALVAPKFENERHSTKIKSLK